MQEISNEQYDEEWEVIIANTKAKYTLNKAQAHILLDAIARKEKAVVFQTFIISIPYIAEMYRKRRFLKGALQLEARATEEPYQPISKERMEDLKKEVYSKIGKPIK